MSRSRSVRNGLLVAVLSASLTLPMAPTAQAVPHSAAAGAGSGTGALPAATATWPGSGAVGASGWSGWSGGSIGASGTGVGSSGLSARGSLDEVRRIAQAPATTGRPAPAPAPGSDDLPRSRPGELLGELPGTGGSGLEFGATGLHSRPSAAALRGSAFRAGRAGVPCTADAVTDLTPRGLADFLTQPDVTADGCLRALIWSWDPRLAPVMSDAHIQAVADRITAVAPQHDGTDKAHLSELWTYLHAAVHHDFSRPEIDLTDEATLTSLRDAISVYADSAHTFDPTRNNAFILREALVVGSAPGLRQHQLPLIKKVLATMAPDARTATDPAWGGAALGALTVNYLGVNPGNQDTAFRAAVAADPSYRAAFRAFSGYAHLKGTPNAWVARDALSEYGRFGQIDGIKDAVVTDLGHLLDATDAAFGDYRAPWAVVAAWLNYYGMCERDNVCAPQIEDRLFPRTYRYDSGAIQVRTALPRAEVDRLYYAGKQVKAQFFRVLGTTRPLPDDQNSTLTVHVYANKADYELFHPLLTGLPTDNGGIYVEGSATLYTFQRTAQDTPLTLEELFRHEYVHYLNGRWAVPGTYGDGNWYDGDRTTAMDEGTAEFFDGATRDDGIEVRRSLVRGIVQDTAGGRPRMTVAQMLHATYDGDGFRFYDYAGTFFEFLWAEHPSLIRLMYRHLRANDPARFDAWRADIGADVALQRQYDAFLDRNIAHVAELYQPDTAFVPNASLRYANAGGVAAAFAEATRLAPSCRRTGDQDDLPRFVCAGRITADLSDSRSADQVFKDMSETVDRTLLDRTARAASNFTDMNCFFGPVEVWPGGESGSAHYTCEGPLRQ
ncbi:collagenase [Wenjunlia tyrosinilytica]|uniref:microbial collagenase n=1 Tax=Wenjunlia tyrosinilytica TaxID=1544741 RepID=A0A918DSB9_9ACTN|nr:collagenase [Wenjunlia tyrosinilytica]GGO80129.1 hypothetical protein GCM10012280_01270 [Wenjunlia tyrosinilytica]